MVGWGPGVGARLLVLGLLALATCCRAFQFVYVPCDSAKPMEEWQLLAKKDDQDHELGCLTEHLQSWYRKSGKLTEEQKKQFRGHIAHHMKERKMELGPDGQNILYHPGADDIMGAESVEIVTLLPPLPEYGHVSITMYVDDKGVARNLPFNERATQLMCSTTQRAGPVVGDAFFGRAYDNEGDVFKRLDLCLSDMSSSAGWFKLCQEYKTRQQHDRAKIEATMQAMKNSHTLPEDKEALKRSQEDHDDQRQSVKDEEDPLTRDGYAVHPAMHEPAFSTEREVMVVAEAIKDIGNQHFGAGLHELAKRKYLKALRYLSFTHHINAAAPDKVEKGEVTLMRTQCELNIALCYLKTRNWRRCVEYCDIVLDREPANAKALFRKGCAQRDFGSDMHEARSTLKMALRLAPGDESVKAALRECDVIENQNRRASVDFSKKVFGGKKSLYPEKPVVAQEAAEGEEGPEADVQSGTRLTDEEMKQRTTEFEEMKRKMRKDAMEDEEGKEGGDADSDMDDLDDIASDDLKEINDRAEKVAARLDKASGGKEFEMPDIRDVQSEDAVRRVEASLRRRREKEAEEGKVTYGAEGPEPQQDFAMGGAENEDGADGL